MLTKLVGAVLCVFAFFSFDSAIAKSDDLIIEIDNGKLTVTVHEASLKTVCEKMYEKAGKAGELEFKGDERLFDTKVSGSFKGLSLAEGVKRVLRTVNHSIVYQGDVPKTVHIFGIGKDANGKHHATDGPETDSKTKPPAGLPADMSENFRIIRDVPTPGGPVELSDEVRDKLKIVRDVPTPGGPVKLTEKAKQNLQIVRDCPPPCVKKEIVGE